ncbi:hypothetical protein KA107_03265 [Candidatus Pacearchaeota archaeon]|nr:hypothetical protein [Candidatus Pacearchaeota archaeon]
MTEQLETKLEKSKSPTLKEELKDSIKAYPQTWKKYFKQLAPAIGISSIGSAVGQWAAYKLGYEDNNLAMTASAYICGYIPGFTYFFTSEYLANKDKYPQFFSKEMGKFAGTFFAADYVADMTTFTPEFMATNVWLNNNTDLGPISRSLIAWNSCGMLYLSAMAGLHPLTRRITEKINKGITSLKKKIKTIKT